MKSAWPSWKRAETASADTNILIYAVAQDAGERTAVARSLMRELALWRGVLTLQSLGEFYFNVTKKFKVDSARAATWVEDWQAAFTIAHAVPATLGRGIFLAQHYRLPFWDALLVATAAERKVSVLFSEDFQDGQVIDGVRIINPFIGVRFPNGSPGKQ
jgi:predicted nucleic acid-binding protein